MTEYHASGGGSAPQLHEIDPLSAANAAMRDAAVQMQQFTDRMEAVRYHHRPASPSTGLATWSSIGGMAATPQCSLGVIWWEL